jgi:hypothetical protein
VIPVGEEARIATFVERYTPEIAAQLRTLIKMEVAKQRPRRPLPNKKSPSP